MNTSIKPLRIGIAAVIAVSFLLFTPVLPAESEAASSKPEAVGLVFHADWCGSCKVMDPKIREAREKLGDAPALFVILDLTDEATSHQAAMLAEALGYGDIFRQQGGRTGAMLLVNKQSGQVVEAVTREDNAGEIQAKVKTAIQGGAE